MTIETRPGSFLQGAFAGGRAEGRALLMPFFVCGYPHADTFVSCVEAASDAGADVFEIGIPFSDPIMDGPVIQAATTEVLRRGQTTAEALELVALAVEATRKPVVAMTYYNIIYRYGLDGFARTLADIGVAGVIVPDLSVEDAGPWREACAAVGIAPVFMAAQTSPPERLALIGEATEGFVYAASVLGVTGVRDSLDERARSLVSAIRERTGKPVAVGIGVSTIEQARTVAAYADGVIVGSALVGKLGGADDPAAAIGGFVAELRGAVSRGVTPAW